MRKKAFVGLMVGLALLIFSSMAMGSDTSPYLIGAWEDNWYSCEPESGGHPPTGGISKQDGFEGCIYTDFIIVNPTPAPVTIIAAFFNNTGIFLGCVSNTINADAKWYIPGGFLEDNFYLGYDYYMGTAKFFAFPVPTPATAVPKTVNASIVIGGYQLKNMFTFFEFPMLTRSESNLDGVVLNSITTWEFTDILNLQKSPLTACIPFQENPPSSPK